MGKRIERDLVGMRFGKLVVLEKGERSANGHQLWKCQCDCGNISTPQENDLLNGRSKSCGHCNRLEIEPGMRFGRLTTIKECGHSKSRCILWECKCDCGKAKIVSASSLRTGNVKSCGCLNENDLSGMKFGRWTVVGRNHSRPGHGALWDCICDCGNTGIVKGNALLSGASQSCGCLNREISTKHGLTHSRIYNIWGGMKNRCYAPHNRNYEQYGGRGISVCDEWKNDFMSFYNWSMNNGYSQDLTIDRIDVNGNYCPENCRWADWSTQNKNKRPRKSKKKESEEQYGKGEKTS